MFRATSLQSRVWISLTDLETVRPLGLYLHLAITGVLGTETVWREGSEVERSTEEGDEEAVEGKLMLSPRAGFRLSWWLDCRALCSGSGCKLRCESYTIYSVNRDFVDYLGIPICG